MVRRSSGMDPSPLLPLGVLFLVVLVVFTPLAFQVTPVFVETTHQIFSLLWVVPVVLVAALFFLTSSDILDSSSYYNKPRPVYRQPYAAQYSGEGPSWGLLGLMLLMLVLLPWRY